MVEYDEATTANTSSSPLLRVGTARGAKRRLGDGEVKELEVPKKNRKEENRTREKGLWNMRKSSHSRRKNKRAKLQYGKTEGVKITGQLSKNRRKRKSIRDGDGITREAPWARQRKESGLRRERAFQMRIRTLYPGGSSNGRRQGDQYLEERLEVKAGSEKFHADVNDP